MAGHEAPTLARRHGGSLIVKKVHTISTVTRWRYALMILVAATLIGLPSVQLRRGHVNVDLIPLAFKRHPRFVLAVITLISSSLIIAIVMFYGFEYWHLSFARGWTTDTVTAVPLWVPYFHCPWALDCCCFRCWPIWSPS